MTIELNRRFCTVAAIFLLGVLFGANSFAAKESNPLTVEVLQPFVDIRTGAGSAYPVFYVAQRGELLEVTKSKTQWYKVGLASNGKQMKIGWVHRTDLEKTKIALLDVPTADYPGTRNHFNHQWVGNYSLGRFEDADLMSLNLGYRQLKTLVFETRLSAFTGVTEQGWMADVQLLYLPFQNWRVKPFASAGYGYLKRQLRSTLILQEDESDHFLLAGLGLMLGLNAQYQLRFEYNQFNTLTSTDDNAELDTWLVGLSAYF